MENKRLKKLQKMKQLEKYNINNNAQKQNQINEDNGLFPKSNKLTNDYNFSYTGNNFMNGYSYYHPSTWNYEK